jgi:hypothetical protein
MEPKQIAMLVTLLVCLAIGIGSLLYVLANLDREDNNGDNGHGGH